MSVLRRHSKRNDARRLLFFAGAAALLFSLAATLAVSAHGAPEERTEGNDLPWSRGTVEPLLKRQSTPDKWCFTKDGRRLCNPLCGSCGEGDCCRGTDMTCGRGPAFCGAAAKCTPQFSIGTCPAGPVNHNYDWWETDGPGGSDTGRILVPEGFPQTGSGKSVPTRALDVINPNLLSPNKMLPVGAACNRTAATPWGGCDSSCCLNGRCQLCDKCEAPGKTTKCKWCIANKKNVSSAGCLQLGDSCTLKPGLAGVHPSSHCKTGCCKFGKCQWCETCMYGCKCGTMGFPLNPNGRCVTKTRTTTRTVVKTTRPPPPPPVHGGGAGYGAVIYGCSRPGVYAMTFDDGPAGYTEALLDILQARGVKATFFVNGQNQDNVYNRAATIRRMRDSGHCVASHGWFHNNMPSLGYDGQVQNIRQLDDALGNILGLRPRFFRPPYGAYDDSTRSAARALGYDLVIWNIDTLDWSFRNPDASMGQIYNAMGGANPGTQGFIALEHDIFPETVYTLAPRAIDYIQSRGFRLVDMGTCWTGSLNGCYR